MATLPDRSRLLDVVASLETLGRAELEIDTAVEVLEVWSRRRSGTLPTPEQAAEALCHYATHDTHLPPTCHGYGCGRPGVHLCQTCGGLACGRHAGDLTSQVECLACSLKRAGGPGTVSGRTDSPRGRGQVGVAIGLQIVGGLFIAIGLVIASEALFAVGTCLLVVGACIWLGAFVLRIMG